MKKGLLIVVVALLAGYTANAQLSVGFGYQLQDRQQKEILTAGSAETTINHPRQWYHGFYAGASYNFHLVAGLNLAPGLYFNYNHYSKDTNYTLATFKVNEHFKGTEMGLSVNALLNYRFYFRNGDFILAPYLGPTINYAFSWKENLKISGGSTLDCDLDVDEFKENSDGRAQSHINLYASAGIMFMWGGHFRLNVGYDFGLINRRAPLNYESAGTKHSYELYMNNFNVGIGYEF